MKLPPSQSRDRETFRATPQKWMFDPETKKLWLPTQARERERAYTRFRQEQKGGITPFVGREGVLEQPHIQWALEGVIQDYSVNMLFGESETFKTFFALDWAWTLNNPELRTWHGLAKNRDYHPMYLYTEGRAGLRQRMLAWEQQRKVGTGSNRDENSMVWIFDQVDLMQYETRDRWGRPIELEEGFSPDHVQLMDIYQQTGRNMLIVDTLSATMFGDTNDNMAAQRYMDSLKLFTDYGPVLVIHHTQKGDAKEFRGASVFRNSSDVMLLAHQVGTPQTPRVTLQHYKHKDGAKVTLGTFGRKIHQLPDERTSITLEKEEFSAMGALTDDQRNLLLILQELGPTSAPDLAQARDGNKKARTAVQKMLSRMGEAVEYNESTGLWAATEDVEEL